MKVRHIIFSISLSVLVFTVITIIETSHMLNNVNNTYNLNFHENEKSHYIIGISTWSNSSYYQNNVNGFKAGIRESGISEQNVEYITEDAQRNATNYMVMLSLYQFLIMLS